MIRNGSLCLPIVGLAAGLWLSGCSLPHGRFADSAPPEVAGDLATAVARVDLAIDAANECVAGYMHRYDSPSITPGDVLDAALTECQPFFAAHRAAVHALTALNLHQAGDQQAQIRAEQEAERYANSFRRIVRETGLTVLVQRRTGTLPIPHHGEDVLSL